MTRNGDSIMYAADMNITAIVLQILTLPADERKQIFARFNINDENQLLYTLMHGKSLQGDDIIRDVAAFSVHKRLLLYVPPILLLVGTFGNIFSFIILTRHVRKVSTYNYLTVLAIMDILVLYVGLLQLWIGELTDEIVNHGRWLCKILIFLGYVSSDASVWLIIAVTVERFIAVCFPLKAYTMCNIRKARCIIFLVICLICIINVHFLWTVDLKSVSSNDTVGRKCEASDDHKVLVEVAWPWVDAAIYSFLPFVAITILNSLIVRQIFSAKQKRHQLQYILRSPKSPGVTRTMPSRNQGEGSKKLTCMLMSVSCTFLLTTLPMNICLIIRAFWNSNDVKTYATFTLLTTIAKLLMYTNHSINFFLYCATGRKFRKQFQNMTCICCTPKVSKQFMNDSRSPTSMVLTRLNSTSSPKTIVVDRNSLFHSRRHRNVL
ncbi:hypothetical protein CHS0354_006204 [Potamilus streckersoni]|uniref:G-protein coupled receptors family 1 profile domain-containing protein n=1 Tax=Potamilus streckersoni TaxID=2493646 RepID=A0AAE0VZP4_9BIVA|nr:hypothetical protein CHS0354_006204 [Potamilus streckersoni]